MTKIFTILAGIVGLKAFKIIIASAFVTIVIAFYSFVINAVILAYNLNKQLFDYLSNPAISTDSYNILHNFYALLNAVGIIDAIDAFMPTFLSACVFLFSKILYKATVSAYKQITSVALLSLS